MTQGGYAADDLLCFCVEMSPIRDTNQLWTSAATGVGADITPHLTAWQRYTLMMCGGALMLQEPPVLHQQNWLNLLNQGRVKSTWQNTGNHGEHSHSMEACCVEGILKTQGTRQSDRGGAIRHRWKTETEQAITGEKDRGRNRKTQEMKAAKEK